MKKNGYTNNRRFATQKDLHRINRFIKAREVRLIGEDGQQHGIVPISDAWRLADNAGLDLVEIAPQATPPVCKILDYGKLKYKEQKKESEARKKRVEIEIKELRIRYSTDTGDLETKLRKAREFLTEGDKVKFSMRFKGREAAHLDLGIEKLNQITESLKDIASIDEQSPPRGRQIYIVYTPIKNKPGNSPKPLQKND